MAIDEGRQPLPAWNGEGMSGACGDVDARGDVGCTQGFFVGFCDRYAKRINMRIPNFCFEKFQSN